MLTPVRDAFYGYFCRKYTNYLDLQKSVFIFFRDQLIVDFFYDYQYYLSSD